MVKKKGESDEIMRVAMIDNDPLSIDCLISIFSEMKNVEIVKYFYSETEALREIEKIDVDILFMAIDMQEINGLLLAEKIIRQREDILIVFATGSCEYAMEACNIGASGYITKPFSVEQIKKTLLRLEKLLDHSDENKIPDDAGTLLKKGFIASTDGSKYYIHNLNDILYFSMGGRKVCLRTMQSLYTVEFSMKDLEEMLEGTSFMRCQKSYIVNLQYVESIDVWFNQTYLLNIKGTNEKIPVSRMFSKRLKKMMFR